MFHSHKKQTSRVAVALLSIALFLPTMSAQGALQTLNDRRNPVLIGQDDENVNNPDLQIVPAPPNQTLNKADQMVGRFGFSVLIGRQGSDLVQGGDGRNILIGGPELSDPENVGSNDIILGEGGDDINIWSPGDGNDAFNGGGGRDTQIFGLLELDADNLPVLRRSQRRPNSAIVLPRVEVGDSPGFCEIELVTDPDFGYDHLVRFFDRETGELENTIRLKSVQHVICASEAGGEIILANLSSRGKPIQPTLRVVRISGLNFISPDLLEIVK